MVWNVQDSQMHVMCLFLGMVVYGPQEIQYMEEEHHRAKSALQSRVKDREEEIQKLRNQVGPLRLTLTIRCLRTHAYIKQSSWSQV